MICKKIIVQQKINIINIFDIYTKNGFVERFRILAHLAGYRSGK